MGDEEEHMFTREIDGLLNRLVVQRGQHEHVAVSNRIKITIVRPKICRQCAVFGRTRLEKIAQYARFPVSGLKKHARIFIVAFGYLHAPEPRA